MNVAVGESKTFSNAKNLYTFFFFPLKSLGFGDCWRWLNPSENLRTLMIGLTKFLNQDQLKHHGWKNILLKALKKWATKYIIISVGAL